ncbi:hypothetical protein BG011_005097 [Mortierella polycephala]|uniref:Uncharacterized protein n=1 Tax=Mortierella polycephala TaxID=41804 RepID=A0A9P6PZP8_9FUNG|nr:hypothetical protein BG011_005097 [Mortierella polycephala]
MSAATHQSPRQETEPLLQAQQYEDGAEPLATVVNTHGELGPSQPLQQPLPKVDRLQHHREMVRVRFSANWWLEWIIILQIE